MDQITLGFEQCHSRRRDASTSHEAAASAHSLAAAHCALIAGVLESTRLPLTGEEIADRCGLTMVQVCRRLSDLEKQGLARPTTQKRATRSGRLARCWGVE